VTIQRALVVAILCVALFAILGGVGLAHHSRAGVYETNDKMITMKGTVVEWKWRNPHTFLVWQTKDANGKAVEWTGELSSITTMIAEGMNRNSFKPGEEVTITTVPALSGSPQSLLVKVVTADGRVPIDRLKGRNGQIPD
jgi:hypothetical protein